MKYLFVFSIALCFASIQSISQDQYLDSLTQATREMKDDTIKVMNLLSLSRSYSRSDLNQSRLYCDQAWQIANKLNFGRGIAGVWFERSIITVRSGNIDSAMALNEVSIRINDSLNIIESLAHNHNLMGSLFLMKNQSFKARDSFWKGLTFFQRSGDSTNLMYMYNSLGLLHESLGNFDSAAYYFFNFVKLSEASGREEMTGIGLVNLSNVYLKIEDYHKAKEYALQSIELNEGHNRSDLVVTAYKNLGIVHSKEMQYDESLRYFQLGKDLAVQIGTKSDLASIYVNMGNMYEERMLFNQALENYENAINIASSLGNSNIVISSLINIGLIYERKKLYDKALSIYDSCLRMLDGSGNYYELSSVYYNMYKVFELKEDEKNALKYLSSHYSMKDSAVNLESNTAIADLTLRYEREKDQATILAFENESLRKDAALERRTRQRNSFMFGGTGTLLFFITVFMFFQQSHKKNRLLAEHKIRRLEEEKKLLAARFLVEGQEEERKRVARELHDGLGVLLSSAKLHFTTIRQKSPESRGMIDKATKLLEQATGDVRRISHNMMPGLLTKFGFFEALQDLIEQVDEMDGIHAEVKIEGQQTRLKENTEIMLYRIIQEMVNNTLKHAEARNLLTIIKIHPGRINIDYSDDGKGFDFEEKLKARSMGLTSIQSRVKFLGGELQPFTTPGKGVRYMFDIQV